MTPYRLLGLPVLYVPSSAFLFYKIMAYFNYTVAILFCKEKLELDNYVASTILYGAVSCIAISLTHT